RIGGEFGERAGWSAGRGMGASSGGRRASNVWRSSTFRSMKAISLSVAAWSRLRLETSLRPTPAMASITIAAIGPPLFSPQTDAAWLIAHYQSTEMCASAYAGQDIPV